MKKSVLSASVSPKCCYCETGMLTEDGKTVLCTKKGIMQPDSFCKKFKYDPLKRVPETLKLQSGFTQEDFRL